MSSRHVRSDPTQRLNRFRRYSLIGLAHCEMRRIPFRDEGPLEELASISCSILDRHQRGLPSKRQSGHCYPVEEYSESNDSGRLRQLWKPNGPSL